MRQITTLLPRNLVLSALLALALLPARAWAEPITVSIGELRPGQTHIGDATIEKYTEQNIKDTQAANVEHHENKTALQSEFEYVTKKALPVVKTPQGNYILLDGHHRVSTLYSTYDLALSQYKHQHAQGEAAPVLPSIPVSVEADYSQKTWKELADDLISKNELYFDQETLKRARKDLRAPEGMSDANFKKLHGEELVTRYLPQNFKGLHNSPMRATVGEVLERFSDRLNAQQKKDVPEKNKRLKVASEDMVDFLEFLIGDHLKKKGITVKQGHEFDESTMKTVEDAIFGDPQEFQFLKDSCKPVDGACPERVSKALDAWRGYHFEKTATVPIQRQIQAPPAH